MCHYRSNIKKRNCVEIPPLVPVPTSWEVRGLSACGNGPSYFVYLTSNYTNLLSYLRDGSETNTATVRMNYCVPSENLFGLFNQSFTYKVAGHITSTQNISDGNTVKYQAGTYIELNNGFVSGNDFLAEINPCVSVVTTIAAKTDDVEIHQQGEVEVEDAVKSNWLRVYPTILHSGNAITLEASENTDKVELKMYDMQSRHVRSFRLNSFYKGSYVSIRVEEMPGMYVLKAQDAIHSFTQKIIIQ